MHESELINRTLLFIKEQTGMDLLPDHYFFGLKYHVERVYFNVNIDKPCFDSEELEALLRISGKDRVIKHVEPNGYKRIAIFLK